MRSPLWACNSESGVKHVRRHNRNRYAESRLACVLPSRPMAAGVSVAMASLRRRGRRDARRLCYSRFARVRHARGIAAAIRHLLLSRRGARICAVRLLAAARDRSDLGNIATGRLDACRDGRRRPAALGGDRGAHCARLRWDERAGVVAEALLARELYQRDHSHRIQGRRRTHDRDDAAPEALRRQGRWRILLRACVDIGRANPRYEPRGACVRFGRHRAARGRRKASSRASSRFGGRRGVDRRFIDDTACANGIQARRRLASGPTRVCSPQSPRA